MRKWMGLVLIIALLSSGFSSCENLPKFEPFDPKENFFREYPVDEEELNQIGP